MPPALGEPAWSELRARTCAPAASTIGLHPPKRAMDIPEPFAESYFDLMPIHEKLRGARLSGHPQLSAGDDVQHP